MSSGGRAGFDTPYIPRSCNYRWFDLPQICMVLERFDSIIFIGDDFLQPIYGALNILLRRDLMHGALQTWSMDTKTLPDCKCENQFMKASCVEKYVASSDQVVKANPDSYFCQRKPHAYLKLNPSVSATDKEKFHALAPRAPPSNFKHIPIVFSTSPSTSSAQTAIQSLRTILKMADDTGRKTDMLFIGPSAAGHIDIKGRKGNQEIWDFHQSVAKAAQENDVDVLGVWNLTVQANSWDGVHFGQKVAITQAMMVINWLARLESS